MKIYLVRHGEKEGHGFDAPLTEKGKEQIKTLSKNINGLDIASIFSSSNPRSVESAKIISNEQGMKFEVVNNLKEFNRATFHKDITEVNDEEHRNYLNLLEFIKQREKEGKNILLVMNAGINRAIMCTLLGLSMEKAIVLTQNFASITELERKEIYGEKVWCINSINTTYT